MMPSSGAEAALRLFLKNEFMNIRVVFGSAITAFAAATIPVVAQADTVDARCDVYPLGSAQVSEVMACTFSQRQGIVGIQLSNGRRYDLMPVGNQPGNYVDQNGNAAYRQAGLAERGLIFQTVSERIYVYWDTAGIPGSDPSPIANRPSGSSDRVTLRASDPNARINLRRQATIHSAATGYGIPGDRVQLLQCLQDTDQPESELSWCQVRFPRSQAVGWIRSDFILF
ncbi:MAG: SH3 domain-containing protein [Thainema sp.]